MQISHICELFLYYIIKWEQETLTSKKKKKMCVGGGGSGLTEISNNFSTKCKYVTCLKIAMQQPWLQSLQTNK